MAAKIVRAGISPGGQEPWNPQQESDYKMMSRAGIRLFRGDVSWGALQPESPDQAYRWQLTDPMVLNAVSAGFRVLAILHTVPGWANNERGDYGPPVDPALTRQYAYRVARRYLRCGVRDFEIGNEVNLGHPGWESTGKFYVRHLLQPCFQGIYRAAVEAGARVNILMGALGPTERGAANDPVRFLREVYATSGAWMFDKLSWHPYGTQPLTDPAMQDTPVELDRMTREMTGRSRRIWATEYGAPTGGDVSVDEDWHARLVGEAFTAWSRHSFAGPLFWFSARDLGAPDSPEREHHFGLLRHDGTPKPAYDELRRVLGQ